MAGNRESYTPAPAARLTAWLGPCSTMSTSRIVTWGLCTSVSHPVKEAGSGRHLHLSDGADVHVGIPRRVPGCGSAGGSV